MSDTEKQIVNLMQKSNKSAPDMTHALKAIGNGDMQQGLIYIEEIFLKERQKDINVGRIQGCIVGTLGASFLLGVFILAMNMNNNDEHKIEKQAVLNAMNASANEASDFDESRIDANCISDI